MERSATTKQVVKVRPFNYQPSKAEIEADFSVNVSPEAIRSALMRPVQAEKVTES